MVTDPCFRGVEDNESITVKTQGSVKFRGKCFTEKKESKINISSVEGLSFITIGF